MSATPGTIVDDICCRRCSYALRGLSRDGLCPECGTPIAHSFTWDNLYCCDPLWVWALARGAALLGVSFALCAASFAGATFLFRQTVFPVLAPALYPAVYACLLAGLWPITRLEPGCPPNAKDARRTNLIRVSLIYAPPVPVLLDALPASIFAADASFLFAEGLRVATLAISVTCVIFLLRRVNSLIERSGTPRGLLEFRAKLRTNIVWFAGVPIAIRFAIALLLRFASIPRSGRQMLAAIQLLSNFFPPIACLILSVAFLVAAVIFRRDARSADRNWSTNRASSVPKSPV